MFGLSISSLLSRAFTLIIAFTVHEFAHAWTAHQLGDDTPRYRGRLTLNPLAHLDPLGTLMLLFAGFGWAKPVEVNPYALRRKTPAGMMFVAAAGPLSNLMLALLASIPFQLGLVALPLLGQTSTFLPSLSEFLIEFIWINLILLFFNLLPIYPLDGEKVAEYFLPPEGQDFLYRIRPYSMYILFGLILFLPYIGIDIMGWLISWPAEQIIRLLIL
ncbi:MAG: site-2 protease family protein [Anaerolineales bacterium]|nr:site-2 protease family protein [Anaerolineales bacterium]